MATRARKADAKRPRVIPFEGSTLQRLLVALIALKLVGVVLLFDPEAQAAFAQAKVSWSRFTEWLVMGALVLAVLRHGVALFPRTRLSLAVAFAVLVAVAASVGAQDRYLALYGHADRLLGLTFLADMVVLYAAAAVAVRRQRDWVVLGAALAGATALAAGYVIVQRLGIDPIVWSTGIEQVRPIGTLGNAGPMGEYLVVVGSAALAAGALAWRSAGIGSRLALAAGLVLAIVVVQIGARSSLLGLAAGILMIGFLVLRRGAVLTRGRAVVVSVLAIAALAVALGFTNLGERVVATMQGRELQDRVLIYGAMTRATLARPILGWGPDNVAPAFVAHRPIEFELLSHGEIADNAHSWPLQAAVTTGFLGLASLLLLIGANAWVLLRAFRRAPVIAGSFLALGAAYWASALTTVGSFATAWIPWLVLGAAAALSHDPEATPVSSPLIQPTPGGWRAIRGTIAAVVLAGSLTSFHALAANESAHSAQQELAGKRFETAAIAALAATRDDSGRAAYWATVGQAFYGLTRYRDAGDAFAEAAAREPHDASHFMNLAKSRLLQVQAQSDLSRGGPQAALAAARKAVEIDANAADPHATLADIETRLGDPVKALREITIAIERYPDDTVTYDRIAVAAALAVLDRGVARAGLEGLIRIRERFTLRVGLARVCMAQSDPGCVRTNLQRALVLEPNNIEATSLLQSLVLP